ncbi:MAG: rhomboid family intramembrane serine protease [Lachnospiraceae bacterium]|nr:rhomboid family intramembrane serine protease [Lachnospiraceae bacterium]
MAKEHKKIIFTFNSPVILTFSALCVAVLLLGMVTGGVSTRLLFCEYRSSLLDPLTYLRFFGHVLGHAGWDHLIGNLMIILIVGPMLEEKYGSKNILVLMVSTALATGIFNFIVFPKTGLYGASGIAFALILLSSFASINAGEIPITFIIVAILYIGQQVYQGIAVRDNISNMSHIIGGIVGSLLGFTMNARRRR